MDINGKLKKIKSDLKEKGQEAKEWCVKNSDWILAFGPAVLGAVGMAADVAWWKYKKNHDEIYLEDFQVCYEPEDNDAEVAATYSKGHGRYMLKHKKLE